MGCGEEQQKIIDQALPAEACSFVLGCQYTLEKRTGVSVELLCSSATYNDDRRPG
jgi:hypothetical protein